MGIMEVTIKKQNEFPLLKRYKESLHFITKNTIFAYDDCIYTNNDLPADLIEHELQHLIQQKKVGLDFWVENYLNNPSFRLAQEIEAYQTQLKGFKDRNQRMKVVIESAKNLSSNLYGNLLSFHKAFELLK